MNQLDYPGARWWKFDCHTHTPASDDFMKGRSEEEKEKVDPEFWLRKFMEKEIDCVAVTDHNGGEWIDELKKTLQTLSAGEDDKPEWYRSLCLFPGVEISVHGGVHLLAIFDPEKTKAHIDSLLGAVGYVRGRGASNNETQKVLSEVVNIVHERGGVAIPAHADKDKGLLKLTGATLEQVLDNPNLYAMELHDEGFPKPQLYLDKKLNWTEICGSDVHNFHSDNFGKFTWIKMDSPSIEGLKLALLDGSTSTNRDMQADPNRHSDMIIEEICIEGAKYIGRSEPSHHVFSPFLNTIIGGRGSGKSTLLEFMRLVLRREQEIPENLHAESQKYFQVGDNGLLTGESKLDLIYRKGDTRYRLNWSAKADIPSLKVETNGIWQATDGEIKSLFPIYIYSQKQIYELAQQPDALLDIIDQAPPVNYEGFETEEKALTYRYKQLDQKIAELRGKIKEKGKLTGKLNDVSRHIEQIEKSGHKKELQNFRQRQQQIAIMIDLDKNWRDMVSKIRETQENTAPGQFDEQVFDSHQDILEAIIKTNKQWEGIREELTRVSTHAQDVIDKWVQEKEQAEWMQSLRIDIEKYGHLRAQLEQQGIDPEKFPVLLRQQTQYKKELDQIDEYTRQVERLKKNSLDVVEALQRNRTTLTEDRKSFLASVLQNNQSVNIKVKPFGQAWEEVENSIRQYLQCERSFDKDIQELKSRYQNETDKIRATEQLKESLLDIRYGLENAQDQRFAKHVNNLPRESISDLVCWFPEDGLQITFGDNAQNIQQGSPGQKTAALLTFILSYGNEPLLLDQPEDDLDNELIYSLIVKLLRETKSKRQIIVVTHNANIVVNGDAEMVLPLTAYKGKSFIKCAASIQNLSIRQKICDILEGGEQAFQQRYKRIHLEEST